MMHPFVAVGVPLSIRLLAFLSTSAVLGPWGVPWRLKFAAAGVLAVMLASVLSSSIAAPEIADWTALPPIIARELVLGLALGLSNSLVMEAFRVGGELVLAGLETTRTVGPDGMSGSPWSHLSVWLGWTLFFATGSHCQVMDSMVSWCRAYPPGAHGVELETLRASLDWGAHCLAMAWRWTMPLVLSQWIAQATLAALSRLAPVWVSGTTATVWPAVAVLVALAVACVAVGPEQWTEVSSRLMLTPFSSPEVARVRP